MSRNIIFTSILMILSSLGVLFIPVLRAGILINTGGAQFLETIRDKEAHQSVYLKT